LSGWKDFVVVKEATYPRRRFSPRTGGEEKGEWLIQFTWKMAIEMEAGVH